MLSFWEKKYFADLDYIIIGSGISGLSTAASIKEYNPKAKVIVLERGILPTGASTKNAGFACIGSFTEKKYDLELMGESAFLQLIENRWNGLIRLRKRLGDEQIDYINNGGFELVLQNQTIDEDEMHAMNKKLATLFKRDLFHTMPELIDRFGFSKSFVKNIIVNPLDGQIDTGKMILALYRYVCYLQAYVATGAEVLHMEEIENGVQVHVKNPFEEEPYIFKARKVAVCTNAFTNKLLPDIEIKPGRGQVICTAPIPDLKIKGTFNFDEGFYYFRNYQDRIIFGGGRNLDFETETTTEFALNEKIINQLEFYLEEMLLPDQTFTIEHKWSGIMAFGESKLPVIKKVSNNIAVGARLNGMGIALGSHVGDEVARLLMKD